jgi:Fe-S cluster assembly protein SufD
MTETIHALAGNELFIDEFENQEASPVFDKYRKEAMDCFRRSGFPHPGMEAWRQTRLSELLETPFQSVPEKERGSTDASSLADSVSFSELGGERLVFVNGIYDEGLSSISSLPERVEVLSFNRLSGPAREYLDRHLNRAVPVDDPDHSPAALNTAFLNEGALVLIPDDVELESPVQLLHITTASEFPVFTHPRNLIIAGARSKATVIETYVGSPNAVYFTNALMEAAIGEGAEIDHYRIQQESNRAFHITSQYVNQAGRSNFSNHTITLGAKLSRNNIVHVLDGENIHSTMNGLYLIRGDQHTDTNTKLDHAKPNCTSLELFKGILDDRARAIFTGKILVRPDAQKTDAVQANRALLLSEQAQVNSQPQLEIFADDVRCTHGATIGQLDEKQKFYLMSRGIPEQQAMGMLTYAFANEIIEHIRIDPLRDRLEQILANLFRTDEDWGLKTRES